MSLIDQFEIIIFSFVYGIIFISIYDLFNRLFYKIKGKLIRFVLELTLFSILSIVYFFTLFLLNDASLSIYLPISLILGMLFYYKFVCFYMLSLYENIIKSINNKLDPVKVYFRKKFVIIKLKISRIRGNICEKIKKRFKKTKNRQGKDKNNYMDNN